MVRRVVSEAIGTAFLLAAVVGSGIMGDRLAGGNAAIALLANTLATGAALVALILTFGPISGAHFNPAVTLAGGLSATPAEIARVRAQLHLNDPLIVQYWHWLSAAVRGNFGTSLSTGQSVSQQIATRFPVTFGLVVASAIVSLIVGIPLGILSGVRPGGSLDSGARSFSTLGLAVPSFWLGALLLIVFSVDIRIFPVGYWLWAPDSGRRGRRVLGGLGRRRGGRHS